MNGHLEKDGYAPTHLEFDEIYLDSPGYYNFSDNTRQHADSTEYLDQTVGSLAEMENLIKKNFMMQP
jgi:hypothetical protein